MYNTKTTDERHAISMIVPSDNATRSFGIPATTEMVVGGRVDRRRGAMYLCVYVRVYVGISQPRSGHETEEWT
jgi:hypothetical protein